MDKKELRKKMITQRGKLTEDQILDAEKKAMASLRQSSLYKENEWFYPYVSYKKEFPTHFIIGELLKDGKHVAVPKVLGSNMKFFEITKMEDLAPGCMGILEPVSWENEMTKKGVLLMPGLAFDQRGGRIGYGAGFYDKYLSSHPGHITMALAYDLQMIPEVPMERHDHFLDYVFTPEDGIQSCR